jgi:exodeoxyribonuclease III
MTRGGVRSEMSLSAAKQQARLERRLAALAAREHMSVAGPAPDRFRVSTWNVNSVRARREALARFLERASPDLMCLQETKATAVASEVEAMLDELGYRVAHVGHGAYNGVAILSRHPITTTESSGAFGDEHLDREPRLISCVIHTPAPVRVASVYVPHGRALDHWHYAYKLAFLKSLAERVRAWLAEGNVVLAGDINVAPTDSDIFHPDAFVGLTHVTPAEREGWAGVLEPGLIDVDVARWGPDARRFTWWNHGLNYSRNLGMRIDAIAVDRGLAADLDTTWIDHIERKAERPSDHAALTADFHRAVVPP